MKHFFPKKLNVGVKNTLCASRYFTMEEVFYTFGCNIQILISSYVNIPDIRVEYLDIITVEYLDLAMEYIKLFTP